MTILSVNDISLYFGITPILEKVSFALDEADKLGIIGVNGCGKSSLFKIITGEYQPTEGNIFISKNKTVGILTQDGAFDVSPEYGNTALEQMYSAFPELIDAEKRLSELENMMADPSNAHILESLASEYSRLNDTFIRDGGLEFRGRSASILEKMGFDADSVNRPIDTLSGGQRTRLALCRQLSREPDILMLDEPTNHLDIETLGWLESFLASYRKCVMIISHDRYFLDRVTNKTLAIEHHRAKLYNGSYTRSMEQREFDRRVAEKHYKEQQKEIARQEAYIAQQRAWNRERNIIAAESRLKMLDKMEKLERPKESPRPIRMKFTKAISSGNEVLTAEALSCGYSKDKPLFDDVNFLIKKNERVFIVGPNGCGKSTLIKTIIGKLDPLRGHLEAGYNVEVGYYDQENQNLTEGNTVLDELWNAYPNLPEVQIRNTLALFRFVGEEVFKQVSVLSGGERARLTLAKLILSHMNLLILDEPTNHLDIDSREALEVALNDFDGTIITVSHDRYFIDKTATRILALKPGVGFDGDLYDHRVDAPGRAYTEFCEIREKRRENAAPEGKVEVKAGSNKEQYLQNKKNIADARREANRIERLKKEASKLEAELEEIEEKLYGEAATDYKLAAELDARRTEVEDRLMEIYEELE